MVLQRGERPVEAVAKLPPARGDLTDEGARLGDLLRDELRRRLRLGVRAPQLRERRRGEERGQALHQRELVRERQLDVDALDAVGIVAEALERNHHVLVDLERVRMARDRRRARAVRPELPACFRGDGYEAFGTARIGEADDFGGRARDAVVGLADDVADQHHLRPPMALRLGRVADRLHVTLVEMLEAGQDRPVRMRVEIALDLDDRRRRVAHLAEELEADRADRRGHPVQDESRTDDDAVAAFLLHAGEPREELVGDVLAEPGLAEGAAGDRQRLGARDGDAVRCLPLEREARLGRVVDLAQVVIEAGDVEPLRIGRHHAPRRQVVERRPPQHGLLAARVDRDVAADARRVGGRGVAGEHEARGVGGVHRPPRHDACPAVERRRGLVPTGKHARLDRAEPLELLGIDHRRARIERDGAAGIAGAAAAGDDREPELDAALDETAHFLFGVRIQDDERILDAPVGGIGHVRHAREAVERDVAGGRVALQRPARHPARLRRRRKPRREAIDGVARRRHEARDAGVAAGVGVREGVKRTALLDFAEAMAQRIDEELLPRRVVEQVVLQIGIALDDPDVAQHLEQHPRRAARAPLAAQLLQQRPHGRAEQPDHDLAIGERRVVVRDLAQPRGVRERGVGARRERRVVDGVHRIGDHTAAQQRRRRERGVMPASARDRRSASRA